MNQWWYMIIRKIIKIKNKNQRRKIKLTKQTQMEYYLLSGIWERMQMEKQMDSMVGNDEIYQKYIKNISKIYVINNIKM